MIPFLLALLLTASDDEKQSPGWISIDESKTQKDTTDTLAKPEESESEPLKLPDVELTGEEKRKIEGDKPLITVDKDDLLKRIPRLNLSASTELFRRENKWNPEIASGLKGRSQIFDVIVGAGLYSTFFGSLVWGREINDMNVILEVAGESSKGAEDNAQSQNVEFVGEIGKSLSNGVLSASVMLKDEDYGLWGLNTEKEVQYQLTGMDLKAGYRGDLKSQLRLDGYFQVASGSMESTGLKGDNLNKYFSPKLDIELGKYKEQTYFSGFVQLMGENYGPEGELEAFVGSIGVRSLMLMPNELSLYAGLHYWKGNDEFNSSLKGFYPYVEASWSIAPQQKIRIIYEPRLLLYSLSDLQNQNPYFHIQSRALVEKRWMDLSINYLVLSTKFYANYSRADAHPIWIQQDTTFIWKPKPFDDYENLTAGVQWTQDYFQVYNLMAYAEANLASVAELKKVPYEPRFKLGAELSYVLQNNFDASIGVDLRSVMAADTANIETVNGGMQIKADARKIINKNFTIFGDALYNISELEDWKNYNYPALKLNAGVSFVW